MKGTAMFGDSTSGAVDAGKLLSIPSDDPRTFNRVSSQYENQSNKFVLKERTFQRQYAHIYASRLWTMRPRLQKAAKEKWGKINTECRFQRSSGVVICSSSVSARWS